MKRKFEEQLIDKEDMINLIALALDSMKHAVDEKGKKVYNYHNFSRVAAWLDKNKGIKIDGTTRSTSLDKNVLSKKSKKLFLSLYNEKASRYINLSRHNFTFQSKNEGKVFLLVKSVSNLLRFN
jgi:hypothetical protein